MEVILDSNIVIAYLQREEKITAELKRLTTSVFCVSVVTYAECCSIKDPRGFQAVAEFFNTIAVLPLSGFISKRFQELILTHRPRTRWIPDALIAATALENGLSLYTDNRKDFDFIEGLRLHSPEPSRMA
jgi:predicted nucleic acid-binding protein